MEIKYSAKLNLISNKENIEKIKEEINKLNNDVFEIKYTNIHMGFENLNLYGTALECSFSNICGVDTKIGVSLYFRFEYSSSPYCIEDSNIRIQAIENILLYLSKISENENDISVIAEPLLRVLESKYTTFIKKYEASHRFDKDKENEIKDFIVYALTLQEKNKFISLITLKEACEMYQKAESTLKTNIKNGKFKEGVDVKKFGTTWVFDIKALEREYRKIK
jgi:hypothetical protein